MGSPDEKFSLRAGDVLLLPMDGETERISCRSVVFFLRTLYQEA